MMVPSESPKNTSPKSYPRRDLTHEEKLEAQRMKKLWEDYKAQKGNAGVKLTQKDLAKGVGLDTQSAVSQYLTGKIPLNDTVILRFCKYIGRSPSVIRPTLGDTVYALGMTPFGESEIKQNGLPDWLNPTEKERNEALYKRGYPIKQTVTLLQRVESESGQGDYCIVRDKKAQVVLPREEIEKKGIDMADVAITYMEDDSMDPVLPESALVVIDCKDKTVKNRKLYAIDYNGFLLIRLIYENPEGLIMKALNPHYPGGDTFIARKDIQILGRAFLIQYFHS